MKEIYLRKKFLQYLSAGKMTFQTSVCDVIFRLNL